MNQSAAPDATDTATELDIDTFINELDYGHLKPELAKQLKATLKACQLHTGSGSIVLKLDIVKLKNAGFCDIKHTLSIKRPKLAGVESESTTRTTTFSVNKNGVPALFEETQESLKLDEET